MGAVTAWEWDFNNDGTVDSTVQNPTYVYQSDGDYAVRLTVSGPNGSQFREQIGYIHVGDEAQWAKTYGAPGNFADDHATAVLLSPDGGYVVAGYAGFGADAWVSSLNFDGTVRWERAYIGGSEDFARWCNW